MFSNNDDMELSSQLRTRESENVGSKQDEFYSKFGSRAAAAIRRATISDTIRKAKEDHKKAASPLTDPGESGNPTVTKPFRNTDSSSEDERVPPPSSGPGMKNGLPLYPPPRQRRRGPLHQANRVFRPRPSPEHIQLNHQNFNHRVGLKYFYLNKLIFRHSGKNVMHRIVHLEGHVIEDRKIVVITVANQELLLTTIILEIHQFFYH